MNCKKAQDLILTDYLDGEMRGKEKERIEEHLEGCRECREFSVAAGKVGNGLFLGAERAEVPEYLWRRVRETIFAEELKRRTFASVIFEKLKAILYIPRPILAIATVVVLLLAIGTVTTIKINNQATRDAEYFEYLAGAVDNSINDNGSFGTSIEKYFM